MVGNYLNVWNISPFIWWFSDTISSLVIHSKGGMELVRPIGVGDSLPGSCLGWLTSHLLIAFIYGWRMVIYAAKQLLRVVVVLSEHSIPGYVNL